MSAPANQAQEVYFEGGVPAEFPLALLHSVRAHDHPGEVLEEEDITISMPRRFGLSGVVETQIQRYESTQRAGRTVSLNEVFGLIRLVLRRPDAAKILRETGERIAHQRFGKVSRATMRLYRAVPRSLSLLAIFRRMRRTFRDLHAGEDVSIQRLPLAVRVRGSNPARLDPTGTACALYTAALEQSLQLFTERRWRVTHASCQAQGEAECTWQAEEVPAPPAEPLKASPAEQAEAPPAG